MKLINQVNVTFLDKYVVWTGPHSRTQMNYLVFNSITVILLIQDIDLMWMGKPIHFIMENNTVKNILNVAGYINKLAKMLLKHLWKYINYRVNNNYYNAG